MNGYTAWSGGVVCEMNGQTRQKLCLIVSQRDGTFCKCCGALPSERQLILDHKNNNPKDNRPENLQFLCRPCNYLKNPRPQNSYVSENEAPDIETEIEINRVCEPQFKRYACQRRNEEGPVEEKDLMNAGAEAVGVSPVTTKRYLDKMCSSHGIFQRKKIGRKIVIDYKLDIDKV